MNEGRTLGPPVCAGTKLNLKCAPVDGTKQFFSDSELAYLYLQILSIFDGRLHQVVVKV